MKVLDFQKQQPEFKTPIWDYVDALVDDERVADGKAAMAKEARALARAEETYGVSRVHAGGDLGRRIEFRPGHGQAPARAVALDPRLLRRAGELFPLRTDGDAEDHRPWRRRRPTSSTGRGRARSGRPSSCPRPSCRLAVDFEGDGRRDIVDSAPDALASDRQLPRTSRAGARACAWGFEVKLPPGYSGPSGRKARSSRCPSGRRKGLTRVDGRPLGGGDAALLLPAGTATGRPFW